MFPVFASLYVVKENHTFGNSYSYLFGSIKSKGKNYWFVSRDWDRIGTEKSDDDSRFSIYG